jgi:hypothetical protein
VDSSGQVLAERSPGAALYFGYSSALLGKLCVPYTSIALFEVGTTLRGGVSCAPSAPLCDNICVHDASAVYPFVH